MNSHPLQTQNQGEVLTHDFGANRGARRAIKPFTSEAELALREALKRCSPLTVAAACEFRKTGDPINLGLITIGIIERFASREMRAKLKMARPNLRLVEDLGLDSLTLMEMVLLTEEVLELSITNEEMGALRTVEDLAHFVEAKARSA